MARRGDGIKNWAYENAIKALLTIAMAAWGVAFSVWATNVKEAKEAYVSGPKEMTDAIKVQQDMREKYAVIKDRQDRVILVLDDLERRMRLVELADHK